MTAPTRDAPASTGGRAAVTPAPPAVGHVERTADPAVLRWVGNHPVLVAAAPGARAVPVDSPLGPLAATGRVTEVAVVGGDVMVRAGDPASWPDLAPLVHAALTAMDDHDVAALADGPVVPGSAVAPSVGELQDLVDRAAGGLAAAHGGRIEVVDVAADEVRVRLHGACRGCSGAPRTLGVTVAAAVRRAHPDLRVAVD